VAEPSRSGFGARLLQRSLPRELEADVALSFAPEGARCEIRFKTDAAGPPSGFQNGDWSGTRIIGAAAPST